MLSRPLGLYAFRASPCVGAGAGEKPHSGPARAEAAQQRGLFFSSRPNTSRPNRPRWPEAENRTPALTPPAPRPQPGPRPGIHAPAWAESGPARFWLILAVGCDPTAVLQFRVNKTRGSWPPAPSRNPKPFVFLPSLCSGSGPPAAIRRATQRRHRSLPRAAFSLSPETLVLALYFSSPRRRQHHGCRRSSANLGG